MKDSTKPVALITGASAGLGEVFARQLAARGFDLILVARRKVKLASLAQHLSRKSAFNVEIIPADLAIDAGIRKVEQHIRSLKRLDLLINNAGFSLPGKFAEQSIDRSLEMLQVHDKACVCLTHAALPGMIHRESGTIINVSSASAFAPLVGSVMYSATKVFLVNFSKALQLENRCNGIKVQALCPGFFHSEFHDVMRVNKKAIPNWMFITADEIARRSLSALRWKSVVYVPGLLYQVAAFFVRLPGLGDWLIGIFTKFTAKRRREFISAR
ncbi:MAG: SDR family oxidoreductase [Anaerolineaceae bacterium]